MIKDFGGAVIPPRNGAVVASCDKRSTVLGAVDRDRGASRDAAPPTPPGLRVRTTAVRRIKQSQRSRRRIQPSSDGNSCHWLKPKYPAQPRTIGFRSAIIFSRLTPRCRRVSARTRSLNQVTALSAMHRRNAGSSLTVKPRNDRCHGRATALFSVLICSLRRRSMKRVRLAMTRRPAFSLRT
jgi:hypothetical protein